MATFYDYRYYIEGRNLAILQADQSITYDPYVDYSDKIYVTPTVADTSGILLKYSVQISAPSGDQTDIDVDRFLARAIVHYVKAKLIEDTDQRLYEWNMGKFKEIVAKQRRRKIDSQRLGLPYYTGAVR